MNQAATPICAAFNRQAAAYGHQAQLQRAVAWRLARHIARLPLPAGPQADLGAGTGLLGQALEQLAPRLHLLQLDGSPALLACNPLHPRQVWNLDAGLPAALQHGKTGRLRMLAVTGLRRASQVPDLPTVHESGLKGFNTDQWYGVLLPPKATPALLARMHREVLSVVKSQDFVEKAQGQGFDVIGSSPEQFRAHIVAEVAKWKRLVAEVGIKAE
jgi:hypothetical protein